MTRIPELHRLLVQGARFEEEQASRMQQLEEQAGRSRLLAVAMRIGAQRRAARIAVSPARIRGEMRRLRVLLLSLVALLATATIALAASGVIQIGTPVRPSARLKPNAGIGVPSSPGASKLLPLRVADPEGGLPWGMRIVRTTRAELCIQIGRVEDGKLGELGVDGAFHDDGELHPLPANALPGSAHGAGDETSDGNTSCGLAGEAVSDYGLGIERSATGEYRAFDRRRRKDLRDVYYGLLGPQAVSIVYRDGKRLRHEKLVPGTGAYLIVTQMTRGQKTGYRGASMAAFGQLFPSKPVVEITYRLGGKLCDRGVSVAAASDVARLCPSQRSPAKVGSPKPVRRVPLRVHLRVAKHVVDAAIVSFKAPYAVTSARTDYAIGERTCEGGLAFVSLDRDVRRGEVVTKRFAEPFAAGCEKDGMVTIEAVYVHPNDGSSTVVGKIALKQPRGTHVRIRERSVREARPAPPQGR